MEGAYYREAMGMKSFKKYTVSRCKRRTKQFGRPISPFPAEPYGAVNGNSHTFATLLSSVQRLH